jgi:DNA polymerase-3 subunit delta
VVLVVGGEGLLADRAVAAVLASARASDPDVRREDVEAGSYEPGLLSAVTQPSLFGGGVVVVASAVDAANDAFVKDATAYVGNPDPDACLVLRHSGAARAKPLLELARAAGAPEAACLPITKDDEKVEFTIAEFRHLGVKASPAAVRALVDAVGSDLRELAAACSQLALDAEPGGIGQDLVDRYFGGRVEVTGFRVADAAVTGRAEEALRLLRHALATGADPVPLVAAIALKLRNMAKVSAVAGSRSPDVAKELGIGAPWQVDRARRELVGWAPQGLAAAIVATAEADAMVKGGGKDPVYAVERLVLTVAGARGR